MFAISIDIEATQMQKEHVSSVLGNYGFYPSIGGMYLCESSDMVVMFSAIDALRDLPWFTEKVRDVKAFRVENWSDFTELIKRGV